MQFLNAQTTCVQKTNAMDILCYFGGPWLRFKWQMTRIWSTYDQDMTNALVKCFPKEVLTNMFGQSCECSTMNWRGKIIIEYDPFSVHWFVSFLELKKKCSTLIWPNHPFSNLNKDNKKCTQLLLHFYFQKTDNKLQINGCSPHLKLLSKDITS